MTLRWILPNILMTLALLIAPALAQEWTRFRGPNGSGESEATGIPASWTDKDYNWKIELPGLGHASPVLWDEKLFITSGDPETGELLVFCLNAADGTEIWQQRLESTAHHLHSRNSFASSTPAVDADHLYVAWSPPERGTLMAMDHNGKPVWKVDLGPFKSSHGFGTSPIVVDDMVVLGHHQKDGASQSYMMAVDRKTGEVLWKTERNSTNAAYSTPCVREVGQGQNELIFNSNAHGIAGVDPKTGKPLWELRVFDKRSVSSPIVAGGLVFGTCGSGGGGNYIVAVKPGDGNGRMPEVAYEVRKSAPYVPTPVAYGDLMFLWYDKGIVTCIDAPTGEIHWQERIGGNFSGSPVRVRDKVYCLSDEGECVVVAAGKEFKLLGRNKIGELSRSTPAVAGGRMYLRTQKQLASIGGK